MMRSLRFAFAAVALGAWATGPLAGAAGAALLAPTYQSSDPAKGAMMDEPPAEVTVTFSEPLDQSSVMNVIDECGKEIDSGPATVQVNEMRVGIGKTPSGMYKVVYRAVGVGGLTGTSSSSFEFMVHDGKACDGAGGGHDDHGGKGRDGDNDHGNHRGGGGGNGNGHGNHGGGGMPDHGGGGGTSDHGGHSTGGSTHSGTHTPAGGHDGHGSGATGRGEHGGNGHGNHGGGNPSAGNAENPPLANAPGGGPLRADAEAMLIGLGLAVAVGVLGGWLLRMSGDAGEPA